MNGKSLKRAKFSPRAPVRQVWKAPPEVNSNMLDVLYCHHRRVAKGGTPMTRTATTGRTATKQQRPPLLAIEKVETKQHVITEDDVRRRAYELYLQRGAKPGGEVDDWLQAERELREN